MVASPHGDLKTLPPGLECSHVITAHYSLNLPGPGNSHTSDSQGSLCYPAGLNSCAQAIHSSWPPEVLGLQA
ncbi:hypothetical protein AAY473_008694 [Plecturocebus cupreus]